MTFNDCEALHEIFLTPDELRNIANEIERKSKSEFYQQGQIIRFKVSNICCFIYKPEKTIMKEINNDTVETN